MGVSVLSFNPIIATTTGALQAPWGAPVLCGGAKPGVDALPVVWYHRFTNGRRLPDLRVNERVEGHVRNEADMKWDPEDYAKNSDSQLRWARELITRMDLTGSESVLDIGSGDGKVTAEFARLLPRGHALGIDSSPEFVAYASRRYPPGDFPNLEFRRMDARRLRSRRRFDIAFSNAALHWVDDHEAVLRGCSPLLRPGGRLIVSCGGKGNAGEVVEVLREVTGSGPWSRYFRAFRFPYFFYGPDDYRQWLPAAGLETKRLELVPKDVTHPGPEGLAGWLRTTWMPYTDRVPESLRGPFIDDVVAAYLVKNPPDAAGNPHVTMVRLEVEAFRP